MIPLSLSRYLSSSIRLANPIFSLNSTLPFSSSADKYWTQMQKNGSNIERTLNKIGVQLDTKCVTEVLQRCATDKPVLGLRFFIWAGLQPNYRHSSYMYNKACNLFKINRNPGIFDDVIEAFRTEGCLVSVKTFKMVLNLCREAKLANEGLCVLKKMKEFNCQPDTLAYNVVIRLFCEKGDMDEAAGLMREMGEVDLYPDMITYVAMVKGFVDAGRVEDACGLFKVMRGHGCLPNTVLYSTLLDGVCRFGSSERALQLLGEMEKEGDDCKPNIVTYTSVIQSFCQNGRPMEALTILDRMVAYGCAPNRVTVGTLINGLCVEERVDEAYKLIDRVLGEGCVSNNDCYSSLVVSLLRIEKFEEAEKVFGKMLASAVHPDGLSLSLFLRGLCSKGRVLDGFHLYVEIEKLGCASSIDSDIYSIILAGLCQHSHLVEAAKLAGLMTEKGIQLQAPYVDCLADHLKSLGETELLSHIVRVQK